MANAALLKATTGLRALIVGYPGSAKTGSLACLANAGFKLRMLDYDGNFEPLLQYCTPEGLANIDIISLEDRMRQGLKYPELVGEPTAYTRAWKLMDRWKYKNPDGSETDLGASKDWGSDTILVVDGMTTHGQAALRQAMFVKGKTPENMTDSTWGLGMSMQESFYEQITAVNNRFHVIVLAHLKIVGPKDIRKGDDDLTKAIKKELEQLVSSRLFPSALGQALPPVVGGHFPILLEAAVEVLPGDKVRRVIRAVPRPELDLKLPSALALPVGGVWPVSSGLLDIFKLLGHMPPQGAPAAPQPGAAAPQPKE